MKKKLIYILLLLIVISCNDATDIEVKEITTPITINPLVNFDAFVGELPEDEQNCLISKFSNKEGMINFVSENSLPAEKLSDCIDENTNYRILHGLFLLQNIQLNEMELNCIKQNNLVEKFDYLGETFGAPMFTYTLGSLFCLEPSTREQYESKKIHLFEGFIESKPLLSILPNNINTLECISNTSSFDLTKDSLEYIYASGGFFPIQILSQLPTLIDCIEIPEELSSTGLNKTSSQCLSDKLSIIFADPTNPEIDIFQIPAIILDIENCDVDAISLLRYFEINIPEIVEEEEEEVVEEVKKEEKKEKEVSKEIPKEIEEQVLSDDRFLCLTEKLELTDILEFLYTGILSEKIIKSATDCDIAKEEIENIDLSEILGN